MTSKLPPPCPTCGTLNLNLTEFAELMRVDRRTATRWMTEENGEPPVCLARRVRGKRGMEYRISFWAAFWWSVARRLQGKGTYQ